jgi:hypothetical protein
VPVTLSRDFSFGHIPDFAHPLAIVETKYWRSVVDLSFIRTGSLNTFWLAQPEGRKTPPAGSDAGVNGCYNHKGEQGKALGHESALQCGFIRLRETQTAGAKLTSGSTRQAGDSGACVRRNRTHPLSLPLVLFFLDASDDAVEGLRPEMCSRRSPEQQCNVRIRDRVRDLVPSGDADLQGR